MIEFIEKLILEKYHKRAITTYNEDWDVNDENNFNLRTSKEYEVSEEQNNREKIYSNTKNVYNYLQKFFETDDTKIMVMAFSLLSLTKTNNTYKNYIDLGTGLGIIPAILSFNKQISILGTDCNNKLVNLINKSFDIPNVKFECQDLTISNCKNFKNQDVLLINGTEFALDDKTILKINEKAFKNGIKEIWITSNHVFEWNFKPHRSYFWNLIRLILKPSTFKKGRLIGYYRSLTLLKKLFKNYKLIERIEDFCETGRLFLKFKIKK